MPKKRITLNLAPADLPKEGSSFDLAMAVAILLGAGIIKDLTKSDLFIGELALDGTIRPVRGVIGKLLCAKQKGFKRIFIPEANLAQANLVKGLEVVPLNSLKEAYDLLAGVSPIKTHETSGLDETSTETEDLSDFDEI